MMVHSPRTLAGALILAFVSCSMFVACDTAKAPESPNPQVGSSSTGLCGDPWADTGSLAVERQLSTATRLANGTVIVAGGLKTHGTAVAGAERYNPATETWSAAGTLNAPRQWHRAVLLRDGRAMVVGGITDLGPTETAEIYNPATNAWTSAAPMSTPRWAFQVIV